EIVALGIGLEILPADAEVQSEVPGQLVVVLEVKRWVEVVKVCAGVSGIAAVVLDIAEQEIDQRRAGVLPIEGETAPRISDLVEGDVAVKNVAAEIQQIPPKLPADVIAPVPVAVGAVTRTNLALEVVSTKHVVGAA